jgi:hypothetical protein
MAMDDVEAYRLCAEEYRTMAGNFRDPLARSMLLRLADDWDKMASSAEKSSDQQSDSQGPLM